MRLLYVTHDILWPLSFGGDIRKWNLLQGVQQAGDTDVLVLRRPGRALDMRAYAGCRQVWSIADPLLSDADRARYEDTIGRAQLVLGRRAPVEWLDAPTAHDLEALDDGPALGNYDLVWFAGTRAAAGLSAAVPGKTILDGDDFAYIREWGLLRAQPAYGAKLWNYLNVMKLWFHERTLPRAFSRVVRCSVQDAARHPARNVAVIPNGTIVPAEVARVPEGRLIFVGDLGYAPNAQGVDWLLREVWPLVRKTVPTAMLDLVGRHASAEIHARGGHDGIRVVGFVEDLTGAYVHAAASVVPLHAGSGTRLKILESLAHAVPAVSTTIGASGLALDESTGLMIADTPETFAATCVAILQRPGSAAAIAAAGRAYVAAQYDWHAIRDRVAALVTETLAEDRRG